ncbi:MAG TPA: hypothetical protein VFU06_05015 [Longimicrobiales bacterium]|nr:hypothetical protein [Longimicrobiales bacterium]
MRRLPGSLLVALALLGGFAHGAHAQRVSTAVVPQTITVGDVFHAAVRVELPAGAEAAFPDTLALPSEDIEAAARVRVQVDTTATGRTATALYALTAWRANEDVQLPDLAFTVRAAGGGVSTVTASFPVFQLTSVLPADTAGIEPKPARDVWGASRLWWPILLALAALLLVALLAWYVWRRRRPREIVQPATPGIPPRQRALDRLAHARTAGFVERGELKPFYTELAAALREYLEAIEPLLGADLTTGELAMHARRRGAPPMLLELIRILGRADLVKFARARPSAAEAYGDLDAARRWVEQHDTLSVPREEAVA